MRILWLADFYPPQVLAGAELMAHEVSKALVAAGHDVHVAHRTERSSSPARSYVLDGVTVHAYSKGFIDEALPYADAVLTQSSPAAVLTDVHRARRVGKPIVTFLHSNFLLVRHLWIQARPDLTVFNSAWMREDMLRHRAAGQHLVLHPPTPLDAYDTSGDVPIGDPRRECITLVNLTISKGCDTFAAVAEAMPEERFLGQVGGYYEQRIRYAANVEVQPLTTDMTGRVYRRTKLLLVPSSYESWGRAAAEAMCSGVPVVAADTPGLCEMLDGSGLVVSRRDPRGDAAWVDAVRAALQPETYAELSRRARRRAEDLDGITRQQLADFVTAVEQLGG